MPDLIVTNFNSNFTGVSSTTANVVRKQLEHYDMALAGHPLPGCPKPISKINAIRQSKHPSDGRPFTIWHVRRNPEMRTALWVRDVLRRPIRIVFTSAAIRRHSAFPRWLISRMDAVIATSQAAADFVPNVQAVAPHGVDPSTFFPAPDRKAAWAATGFPGACGLATIGRIRPEKGTDRFVKTMLALLPHTPGVTALVIGRAAPKDQAFLDALKTEINQAGLKDRILFPGEIQAEALPELVQSLSAIVQLPRYEGYGMTPLEGMAAGVPFIATDEGNYRNFSAQGTCGIIVGNDNPHATAGAITALLSDTNRHEKMALNARKLACNEFSTDRETQIISDVYDTIWAGYGLRH